MNRGSASPVADQIGGDGEATAKPNQAKPPSALAVSAIATAVAGSGATSERCARAVTIAAPPICSAAPAAAAAKPMVAMAAAPSSPSAKPRAEAAEEHDQKRRAEPQQVAAGGQLRRDERHRTARSQPSRSRAGPPGTGPEASSRSRSTITAAIPQPQLIRCHNSVRRSRTQVQPTNLRCCYNRLGRTKDGDHGQSRSIRRRHDYLVRAAGSRSSRS